jgi:hypothetical protein
MALRHQIGVLQRSAKKRLVLNNIDRVFWIGLSRIWSEWRSALRILKPDTRIIRAGVEGDGRLGRGTVDRVDHGFEQTQPTGWEADTCANHYAVVVVTGSRQRSIVGTAVWSGLMKQFSGCQRSPLSAK